MKLLKEKIYKLLIKNVGSRIGQYELTGKCLKFCFFMYDTNKFDNKAKEILKKTDLWSSFTYATLKPMTFLLMGWILKFFIQIKGGNIWDSIR
jgi:hypothetical protein